MSATLLLVRKCFTALSLFFRSLAKRTYRSRQEREVDRWLADEGDRTLRVEYDLTPDSIVLDLGGYVGDWASEISARYACKVLVFEPVAEYHSRIKARFRRNERVEAFAFGLGAKEETLLVRKAEEGSSSFASPNVRGDSESDVIRIVRAADFLSSHGLSRIDLMKINIEGGEYGLLEHLLDAGLVPTIKDIQVQFHDFVPDAEKRMRDIQSRLSKTHVLTYHYPFVWENWTRGDR